MANEVGVAGSGGDIYEMGVAGSEGLSSQAIASPLLPPPPPPSPILAVICEVHATWRFTAIQAVDNDGKAYAVGQKHVHVNS